MDGGGRSGVWLRLSLAGVVVSRYLRIVISFVFWSINLPLTKPDNLSHFPAIGYTIPGGRTSGSMP